MANFLPFNTDMSFGNMPLFNNTMFSNPCMSFGNDVVFDNFIPINNTLSFNMPVQNNTTSFFNTPLFPNFGVINTKGFQNSLFTTPALKTNNNIQAKSKTNFATPQNIKATNAPLPKEKISKSGVSASGYNFVQSEVAPGCSITKCNYVNVSGLKPDMKNILAKLDKKAKEMGFTIAVGDGYRSHAQQAAAKKRKPYLCAPAGKSAHEYGAAVDLVFIKKGANGKDIVSNDFRTIPEFVNYAKSIGLDWGLEVCGKPNQEYWHFQLKNWKQRPDIASEYRSFNRMA